MYARFVSDAKQKVCGTRTVNSNKSLELTSIINNFTNFISPRDISVHNKFYFKFNCV